MCIIRKVQFRTCHMVRACLYTHLNLLTNYCARQISSISNNGEASYVRRIHSVMEITCCKILHAIRCLGARFSVSLSNIPDQTYSCIWLQLPNKDDNLKIFCQNITRVNILGRNPNLFSARHFGHILFLPRFWLRFWCNCWCGTPIQAIKHKNDKKNLWIF